MKSSANLSYESWNWSPGKWSSIRPLGGGCPCCGGKPHRWPNNSGKQRIVKLQLGILRSFSTPVWTLVKHFWGLPLISGGIQPWRLAFLGSSLPIVRQTAWACPGCPCSQLCLALLSQVTLQPKFAWSQVWYNLQIQSHPGSRSKSSSGRWRSTCNHYSSNGWCAP